MDKVLSKLNRVEGQVRGVKKLYSDGAECEKVVQQLAAARQALAGVAKDLLTSEAVRCSRSKGKQKDFDKLITKLFKI